MIVVTAFAQIQPAEGARVREALLRAQAKTVKEDGCESYRWFAAIDDDASFVAVENWRDLAALRAHLQAPHIAELVGAVGDALAAPLDIRAYDATQVDPG